MIENIESVCNTNLNSKCTNVEKYVKDEIYDFLKRNKFTDTINPLLNLNVKYDFNKIDIKLTIGKKTKYTKIQLNIDKDANICDKIKIDAHECVLEETYVVVQNLIDFIKKNILK